MHSVGYKRWLINGDIMHDYTLRCFYQLTFERKMDSLTVNKCPSQWPSGLNRGSAVARLLRLWVRIPLGTWLSVSCECRIFSGRVLCDELITRPEESSYRLVCAVACDLET